MTSILIAHDQPIMTGGIAALLSQTEDIHVVGEANNSEKLFELLQNQSVDSLVMTMSLAARNGYSVLEQLKRRYSELPILLLNVCHQHYFVLQTLELETSGYLDNEAIPTEFVNAICKITQGGKYVSEALAEQLIFLKPNNTPLSKRELQILCMIASGKAQKEISRYLCISQKTVSTHKSRTLEKLNLSSNAELIRYAIENNLTEAGI